jgi:hypothetical protein
MFRNAMIALALAVPVSLALAAPARNVSAKLHPNLAAAQTLIGQAYTKVEAAQTANDGQLGGHAEKAKQLLAAAADEIKLAAEAANSNH